MCTLAVFEVDCKYAHTQKHTPFIPSNFSPWTKSAHHKPMFLSKKLCFPYTCKNISYTDTDTCLVTSKDTPTYICVLYYMHCFKVSKQCYLSPSTPVLRACTCSLRLHKVLGINTFIHHLDYACTLTKRAEESMIHTIIRTHGGGGDCM